MTLEQIAHKYPEEEKARRVAGIVTYLQVSESKMPPSSTGSNIAKNTMVPMAALRNEIQTTVKTACLLRLHCCAPRYSSLDHGCPVASVRQAVNIGRENLRAIFTEQFAVRRHEPIASLDNCGSNGVVGRTVQPGIIGQVWRTEDWVARAFGRVAGAAQSAGTSVWRSSRIRIGLDDTA